MASANGDRNLLFGILAVQMDFITRDALVSAMNAWVLDKAKPLGQILLEQKVLGSERHALLEALVREHLRQHGDDIEKSLAAVSSVRSVREELKGITDPDVQASLAHVPAARPRAADPYATEAPSVGAPSAEGRRFRILRPHAEGGLGKVSVAHDEELRREVALKEIQERHADDPNSRARFLAEAEITGGLEHPSIVPVYGLGQYADGRPFYAMRFIRGDSLKEAVERFYKAEGPRRPAGERALELRKLLGRFIDVCNAIAYAHSRGVLHRDLKPGNIMLGQYGETLVVDWGLAKPLEKMAVPDAAEGPLTPSAASGSAATEMGRAVGTPAYMSPEQAAGRLDQLGPASDVYSLGATLYAVLTGKPPFEERELGPLLRKVERGEFPPPRQVNPKVSRPLEAVCLKAMALRPEDRYASPRALADDLEHWLGDEPTAAYREPLSARLGRWARRNRTLVTGAGALLLTAVVALAISTLLIGKEQQKAVKALEKEQQARKERAQSQVDALLDANPGAVPGVLQNLRLDQEEVLPRLRELWEQQDLPERRRLRVGLALLPVDDAPLSRLREGMLAADAEPAEMLILRDALAARGQELAPDLWGLVDDPKLGPARRFRALVALARFDPANERWAKAGGQAVEQFLGANPLHLGLWIDALRPVRMSLVEPLSAVFRDHGRGEKRQVAAVVLADYAADRPEVLADLLADADERSFPVLFEKLRGHDEAAALLSKELGKEPAPDASEADSAALAKRQAVAAAALLRLGDDKTVWPLYRHSPDPTRRSYLVALSAPLGVEARQLVDRLEREEDPSAKRALLLALGEYGPDQLTADVRGPLTAKLLDWYRDDPDPGVHGAVDWLLRKAKEGPEPRKLDWGQAAALKAIEDGLRRRDPDADRGWYVNGQGQTLVLVPGPVEFRMGSPGSEARRSDDEIPHRRRIGRSFAIASKSVTVEEFQRFLKERPDVTRPTTKEYSPDADGPIIGVSWFMAAQYCNWLSEKEGLPEADWCYPKHADIKEGMKPFPDYLKRKGYRLPTEAEWECAARAGSLSSRYYGSSEELLPRYAWFLQNAQDRAWPVGQKRPNDLGLFDIQGDVWNWTQNAHDNYPGNANGKPVEDIEDKRDIEDRLPRVLRGGSFFNLPVYVRSACRIYNRPSSRDVTVGLRPARTYD